jgi:hypothetical protein
MERISNKSNPKKLLNINIILNLVSRRVKGESLIISDNNFDSISTGLIIEEKINNKSDKDIEEIVAVS